MDEPVGVPSPRHRRRSHDQGTKSTGLSVLTMFELTLVRLKDGLKGDLSRATGGREDSETASKRGHSGLGRITEIVLERSWT